MSNNIYKVLSSTAYDILIFMKDHNTPIRYMQIVKNCNVSITDISYCLSQLAECNLIMKVNPVYFRENARKEYKITPVGLKMLQGFEKSIKEYHDINENKGQLFAFNP